LDATFAGQPSADLTVVTTSDFLPQGDYFLQYY
jgi:hypothetical protein